MGTAAREELVLGVTSSEVTLAEAAGWLAVNPPVGGGALEGPGREVIGYVIRGPGWRLVQVGSNPITLLTAAVPK